MKFLCLPACLLLSLASCLADGGVIIARQQIDGLDVTVFASPAPLRAGPADVSVLVQNHKTAQALLDASVDVTWTPSPAATNEWMPPCCEMMVSPVGIPAQRGHSQNKFLYSAIVPINSSGPSDLTIRVKQGGREIAVPVPLEVGPPAPPVVAYWPWLAFPFVGMAVFGLHQRLARRRGAQ